jgi:hypothetical protein
MFNATKCNPIKAVKNVLQLKHNITSHHETKMLLRKIKSKAVLPHTMKLLDRRVGIAPTHS